MPPIPASIHELAAAGKSPDGRKGSEVSGRQKSLRFDKVSDIFGNSSSTTSVPLGREHQISKAYLIEDNIIYNTSGEAIRFNRCGREDHTWQNNHFGAKPDSPDFPRGTATQAGLEPTYRKLSSQEP